MPAVEREDEENNDNSETMVSHPQEVIPSESDSLLSCITKLKCNKAPVSSALLPHNLWMNLAIRN